MTATAKNIGKVEESFNKFSLANKALHDLHSALKPSLTADESLRLADYLMAVRTGEVTRKKYAESAVANDPKFADVVEAAQNAQTEKTHLRNAIGALTNDTSKYPKAAESIIADVDKLSASGKLAKPSDITISVNADDRRNLAEIFKASHKQQAPAAPAAPAPEAATPAATPASGAASGAAPAAATPASGAASGAAPVAPAPAATVPAAPKKVVKSEPAADNKIQLKIPGADAKVAAWQEAINAYEAKHGGNKIAVDGAWRKETQAAYEKMREDLKITKDSGADDVINALRKEGIRLAPEHFVAPANTPAGAKPVKVAPAK